MSQTRALVDFPGQPAQAHRRARLDGARYTSREWLEREWARIWSRTWLLAGLVVDVAEPGDFFTFDLGRESILVIRDDTGAIRALYNVCQHRGNKLVQVERGSVARLTCAYHGWTYALDGQLLQVPDAERFAGGVDCARRSLKPVRTATWGGFVWINLDPQARPLEEFLGSIPAALAPYRIEDMVPVRDQTVTVDANWKTVVDNFSEVYHVDFLHAQHASFVNCRDAYVELFPFGHTSIAVEGYVTNPRYPLPETPPPILVEATRALGLDPDSFRGRVDQIRAAAQKQKRIVGARAGFDYSAFSDAQVSDIYQYNFFPNVIMTVKPEEVWVMRPRPHPTDPGKCWFDKITLAAPAASALVLMGDEAVAGRRERPEREVFTRAEVVAGQNSMTVTIDQDIEYLPDMQAGLRSKGFDAALLNDDECRIQHFHDWVDEWLGD